MAISRTWLMPVVVIIACGCTTAPAFRSRSDLEQRIETTEKILLIPLSSDVYQISAGGVPEKMDAWRNTAGANMISALEQALEANPAYEFTTFDIAVLTEAEENGFQQHAALFAAVSDSIDLHTYGDPSWRFEDKISNFDYGLGSEVGYVAAGADALLLVSCQDHISTGAREALRGCGIILSFATGVYVGPGADVSLVRAALVDPQTGEILWYKLSATTAPGDLRDPVYTQRMVAALLADFPNQPKGEAP